uniref:Uncharacterized protein n=1 Tax=Ciona intestinalis TaxID=7719 RepID=H2XSB6_CIOIN
MGQFIWRILLIVHIELSQWPNCVFIRAKALYMYTYFNLRTQGGLQQP